MTQSEAIALARAYLYAERSYEHDVEAYKLHAELQYGLCGAYQRLMRATGEVTRRDVLLLTEAFVMQKHNTREPLLVVDTVELSTREYNALVGKPLTAEQAERWGKQPGHVLR